MLMKYNNNNKSATDFSSQFFYTLKKGFKKVQKWGGKKGFEYYMSLIKDDKYQNIGNDTKKIKKMIPKYVELKQKYELRRMEYYISTMVKKKNREWKLEKPNSILIPNKTTVVQYCGYDIDEVCIG